MELKLACDSVKEDSTTKVVELSVPINSSANHAGLMLDVKGMDVSFEPGKLYKVIIEEG